MPLLLLVVLMEVAAACLGARGAATGVDTFPA